MSSVVYVGRGSFRMEAIAVEPALAEGTVQAVVGVVTAPLNAKPFRPRVERDDSRENARASSDDTWRGPDVRPLFGSQGEIPMLAAPTGSVGMHGAPAVTLSRAMVVTMGGLVLLCGVVVGTAARHLLAAPAPLSIVAVPAPVVAPVVTPIAPPEAPMPLPNVPALARVEVEAAPPVTAPMPKVLTIRAHAKPVGRATTTMTTAAPETAEPQAAKPWVDPWAQ